MSNIISNFSSSNTIIAAGISKLLEVKVKDAKTFRLSVPAANDVMPEGSGQFKMEAPVLIQLIDTAYAEIVSAANRVTRKDQLIPLNDRHRHNSGWDDQYDGSDEPEETEQSIEDQLVNAVDRAEIIVRYAKHIAAIKQGGAEWLAGFEVDKWVPVEGLQGEELKAVMKACVAEVNLSEYIQLGKVKKVRSVIENRLLSFNEWCAKQIARKNQDEAWKNKLAYARTLDIVVHDVPVNTACEYIADIVSGEAFNRTTTRLEDAVRRVANNAYLRLAYALQAEIAATTVSKRNVDKALAKGFEFIPYSDKLQGDIAEVKASDEWEDYALAQEVEQAERDAKADMRTAIREQAMLGLQKRSLEIAELRNQAQGIRALIAKQREEMLTPKPSEDELKAKAEAEAAAKAKKEAAAKKAAETRAKNKAAKEAAKQTKGVHKASNKPTYNPQGSRSTH